MVGPRVDYWYFATRARTIDSVKTRLMTTHSRTTHSETTRTETSTVRRLLHAIDRGTLTTMNAPATLRIAAQGTRQHADNDVATDSGTPQQRSVGNRSFENLVTDDQENLMSTAAVTNPELDHELTVLREASVWQLNAAIEAGFVDEVDNISDSYAAAERSLLRRWRAQAA